jgi:hypothetical protein
MRVKLASGLQLIHGDDDGEFTDCRQQQWFGGKLSPHYRDYRKGPYEWSGACLRNSRENGLQERCQS